ncbi:uncharacterized protein LOC135501789 [Lineus longissimus]|uniref:uncharacterized protein LOC135501789 n=1 Tax=Lineus longissimus TaxID=88925 RepID=UPI002B4F656A
MASIEKAVKLAEDGGNSTSSRRSQGSLQCPAVWSSTFRNDLANGGNWTEHDLNKFGIRYSSKKKPEEIFEMIKPYIPSKLRQPSENLWDKKHNDGIPNLAPHIELLQDGYKLALDFDIDSFELLKLIEICQDCPRGHACHETEAFSISQRIFNQITEAEHVLQRKRTAAVNSLKIAWIPTYERVKIFLKTLKSVLKKAVNSQINEGTFVDLFQVFARMFLVQFKAVGESRSSKMGRMAVLSINDLRCDYEDEVFHKPTIVVTVAEVKKTALRSKKRKKLPKKENDLCDKKQKIEGRGYAGGATGSDDFGDSPDDISDDGVDFSSRLRGQLGIELLADIECSCLNEVDNRRMILGLTVEATLVRLTCLEMDMDDLKNVQENLPQENPTRVATIFYTKAYDMLKRDERSQLIYIMRHLLFLSNDCDTNLLPTVL